MIELIYGLFYLDCMIRSLELMASFHRMCECDTWEEVTRVTGKTRERVEYEVGELELILGKRLIYRRPEGDVVSSFSGKFFMPTDAGMKWYLLIGEVLANLAPTHLGERAFEASSESGFYNLASDLLGTLASKSLASNWFFINLSFFSLGHMQNLRIFTNDFLSFYFLEPILEHFMKENQLVEFSTFGSESEHLSDFDLYFLPHELPLKEFSSELIVESRLGLYAHPAYIEKYGAPKSLKEIDRHVMVRNKACRVIQSLGMDKYKTINNYKPLFYKRTCIELDTYLSMLRLCERGFGIMPGTEVGIRKTGTNLHKMPSLEDEGEFSYFKFTFGWHQRHNDNPILQGLSARLRDSMVSG